MLLEDGITIVAVNKDVIPNDQRRDQLAFLEDIFFKLLLLPVVMGISYELLKWCGRSDNIATRIIRQPGLWVQRLTVFEPDDSMIEVAIAAVTPVLPEDPEDGKW